MERTANILHHPAAVCDGPPCPFHAPSAHPMVAAPMHLRETGLIERICTHGVGHPDPDSAAWMDQARGHEPGTWGMHGCDGCCRAVEAVSVRILLDVDGVLNAVTKTPDPEQWPDWQTTKAQGFPITYSSTVGAFFRRLAETPGVEVQWLTTWAEQANEHIAPLLDIPECIVAGRPPFREKSWWKFEVARALWERDQIPFVWIDDDLGDAYDEGAAAWVQSLDGAALGIRPDHRKGLTPLLLDEIDAFVARQVDAK